MRHREGHARHNYVNVGTVAVAMVYIAALITLLVYTSKLLRMAFM
jgi:hypothetical protein